MARYPIIRKKSFPEGYPIDSVSIGSTRYPLPHEDIPGCLQYIIQWCEIVQRELERVLGKDMVRIQWNFYLYMVKGMLEDMKYRLEHFKEKNGENNNNGE